MCKKDLPVNSFNKKKRSSDGLQSQCSDCHKVYRHEHYLKNRKKYISKAKKWKADFSFWWKEYKLELKCSRCGEDHPACIDFHHKHSEDKIAAVASMVGRRSKDKVLAEIEKCEIICSNCHRKLHWQ